MSLHISKDGNRIRATGGHANGILIALSPDATLLKWENEKTGSEDFQRMVKEAITARGLTPLPPLPPVQTLQSPA